MYAIRSYYEYNEGLKKEGLFTLETIDLTTSVDYEEVIEKESSIV